MRKLTLGGNSVSCAARSESVVDTILNRKGTLFAGRKQSAGGSGVFQRAYLAGCHHDINGAESLARDGRCSEPVATYKSVGLTVSRIVGPHLCFTN